MNTRSSSTTTTSTTTTTTTTTSSSSSSSQLLKETAETNDARSTARTCHRTSQCCDVIDQRHTVRAILGPSTELYRLEDFLRRYVPAVSSLLLSTIKEEDSSSSSFRRSDDNFLLWETVVAPLPTCQPIAMPPPQPPPPRRRTHPPVWSQPTTLPCASKQDDYDTLSLADGTSCNSHALRMLIRKDQSLSSLVDDVIGTLVQRRERLRHQHKMLKHSNHCHHHSSSAAAASCLDGRNVLCQGYVMASDHDTHPYHSSHSSSYGYRNVQPSHTLPRNVVLVQVNNTVDYCKHSRLFRWLHDRLGDVIVRMLLLHTSIFVPIVVDSTDKDDQSKEEAGRHHHHDCVSSLNYMQLTGPPVQAKALETKACETATKAVVTAFTRRRRKRKRKQRAPPITQTKQQPPLEPSVGVCRTTKVVPKQEPLLSYNIIPKHLHPQAIVPKNGLYYSNAYVPKVGLPTNHILNAAPHAHEAAQLLAEIFDLTRSSKRNKKQRHRQQWHRLREQGVPLCAELLRRHRACPYGRLLERYGPLPENLVKKKKGDETDHNDDANVLTLPDVVTADTPSHGVLSFLQAVLSRVLPREWLGSSHNWDQLLDHHVATLVKLRRPEQIANKMLMHGMRVTHIPWLFANPKNASRSDHATAELLLLRFLRWLFANFLVPLLSSIFHITETEFTGRRVLFYRKPVWSIFRALTMTKLLQQQYTEITANEARQRVEQQQMGFSRLRLLPKTTGVRPIATLCKRENLLLLLQPPTTEPKTRRRIAAGKAAVLNDTDILAGVEPPRKKQKRCQGLSTNQILNDAFAVLQYEYSQNQDAFGAGIHGLHYFYPRYRRFIQELKPRERPEARIYFGSVDIHHCYDNIQQDELLRVVKNILTEDEYLIQRHHVVYPYESLNRVVSRRLHQVGPPEEFTPFYRTVHELAQQHQRSVFVDGVSCSLSQKEALMAQLKEHLTSHLVAVRGRYGDRYLVQRTGIPQGSVLSTMLCNFYYGSVERKLLSDCFGKPKATTASQHSLLVRMVDDFMLVTTDQTKLRTFLGTMSVGEPALGVSINKEKTRVSVKVSLANTDGSTSDLEVDSTTAKVGLFPWCGMLFDVCTGEVRVDYSRFSDGKGGNNLNVDRTNNPGERFATHMKNFVRPRCLPVLFDSLINSFDTQVINFCQLSAFAAVRTAEYLQASQMILTLLNNSSFLLDTIQSTLLYAFNVISVRLKQAEAKFDLKRSVAEWLGWKAFLHVFDHTHSLTRLTLLVREKLDGLNCNRSKNLLALANQALKEMQVDILLSTKPKA